MSTPLTYQLFVVIYIGRPIDSLRNRHVALYFQNNRIENCVTYNVKLNEQSKWYMEPKKDYNALKSINLVGKIEMCEITISPEALFRMMNNVEIINNPEQGDSNCKIWADKALTALLRAGYITRELYDKASSQTLDIVLEAPQEDP